MPFNIPVRIVLLLLIAPVVGWFAPLWLAVALSVVALVYLVYARSINDHTGNESSMISGLLIILSIILGIEIWLGYGAHYLASHYAVKIETKQVSQPITHQDFN